MQRTMELTTLENAANTGHPKWWNSDWILKKDQQMGFFMLSIAKWGFYLREMGNKIHPWQCREHSEQTSKQLFFRTVVPLMECTELYFQMYNVTVRCKTGNFLASCHLAHCTSIFLPHIMITAIFCMYVYWYNLTLSSMTLGIKRGNILLSNSYPRFPSITLSEIRLISRNIQKCIWWSANPFFFMLSFVMSLQICNLPPSLGSYSLQETGF